ncbi:MAG: HD domain-containing phosphohydrolase [Planctomycetota bacterium]
MNNEKILFVDDDPKILKAIERQFEDEFDLTIAEGPYQGLKTATEEGPFAVVISDMQMPEMTGIEMLTEIRDRAPDTVRIMLTGFADLETTIDAINQGNIYRFLSKPCQNDVLKQAMKDGIRQFQLIRAEKELVEGTLTGSVKVLSEVLGLVNPVAFGRASRVKRIAVEIARELDFENIWEIEIAAMLSALGCVTLSEGVLQKLADSETLSDDELKAFRQHPTIGSALLQNIPRLGNVSRIVAYQEKQYDGKGFPEDEIQGDEIPFGARILKLALDLDTEDNRIGDPFEAIARVSEQPERYDPKVLSVIENASQKIFSVLPMDAKLSNLKPGMVFAEDVCRKNGQLLVAKGQEITGSVLSLLSNYARRDELDEPIRVYSLADTKHENKEQSCVGAFQ